MSKQTCKQDEFTVKKKKKKKYFKIKLIHSLEKNKTAFLNKA